MKKKILSFTDGSAYAVSVYDHTLWAARRWEAQARVMHTLNQHREKAASANFSGSLRMDAHRVLMDELVKVDRERARLMQARGEAILEEARRHFEEAGWSQLETELRHGWFVEVLEDLHNGYDLIVIGKRGENAAIEMKHLGTNIERTLRVARCPVLVTSRKFEPIEKFLIAYDGGKSSRKVLEFVAEQDLLRGLECHLLRVGEENRRNREEMDEVAERLREAGFEPRARIEDGEPTKVITRAVEEGGMDLLAMGAYGHSRAKRLLIGSTTATLARDCHVPILMCR